MKNNVFFIFILIVSFSCSDKKKDVQNQTFGEILGVKPIKKDVIYKNNILKEFEIVKKQLYNIDTITSPKDFEIRIYNSYGGSGGSYYNYALENNKWTAFVRLSNSPTKNIKPNVGWGKFTKTLYELEINNLITPKEINVLQGGLDDGRYYSKVIDGRHTYIEIFEGPNYQFRYYDNIGNEIVSRPSYKKLQNTGKILELLMPHFLDEDRYLFERMMKIR
jgi:hypothetical protein